MHDSPKRTQAERRESTRRQLLDATIDMLMESGLSACSLAAVAKRAGLTTGAMQHHFKTKAALMRAVISERLFAQNRALKPDDLASQSLSERCSALVTQQWQFYGNPRYIAIWDIILGARSDSLIQSEIAEWQANGTRTHELVIGEVLADQALSTADIRAIQYFVNAHLRGLALLRTVEDDPAVIDAQLALLADNLARHIGDLS
ncbi:MAG: TetR/AcrR family transcriptional regulator [Pseudomonadota bacterium]